MVHRVKLKATWPSSFHRTVKIGEEKQELFFQPDVPVDLSDEQFAGVKHDIGNALVLVESVETEPVSSPLMEDGTPPPEPPEPAKPRKRKR